MNRTSITLIKTSFLLGILQSILNIFHVDILTYMAQTKNLTDDETRMFININYGLVWWHILFYAWLLLVLTGWIFIRRSSSDTTKKDIAKFYLSNVVVFLIISIGLSLDNWSYPTFSQW